MALFEIILVSFLVSIITLVINESVRGGIKSYYRSLELRLETSNNEQLERLKAALRSETEIDLERERARLRLATESYLAQAAALTQRRFDILVELHRIVVQVEDALVKAVSPGKVYFGDQTDAAMKEFIKELEAAFVKHYSALYNFYPENRVFWDAQFDSQMEALLSAITRVWRDYAQASKNEKVDVKLWMDAYNKALELSPKIITQLRERIRSTLGVQSDGSSENPMVYSGKSIAQGVGVKSHEGFDGTNVTRK